jgi:hypothetical protein
MPDEEKVVQEGSAGPAAQETGRSGGRESPGARTAPVPQGSQLDPQVMLPALLGLPRRAQKWLMDMLLPGEQPRVVVPGAAGSCIVGTDSRALVLKAGTRFGAPLRHRSKAFEYETVIGVRFDIEAEPPVVAIDAPHKIAACRIYWADSRDDPWKARNAIPITAPFSTVLEQVVTLRALVTSFREHHPGLEHPWEHLHPRATPQLVQPIRPGDVDLDRPRAVVAPLPALTQRCASCRAELRPGWKFCPACGEPSEAARTGPESA